MNLLELFADSLLDAGIDTLKLIPFLFVTYLIMEALERRTEDKSQDLIRKENVGRFGPVFGAHTGDYFFGLDAGFEYSYIFPNEIRLTVTQKNNVNCLHGDSFRNGLLVGVSIPF